MALSKRFALAAFFGAHRAAGDGWILGGPGQSCRTACGAASSTCVEPQRVDTEDKVRFVADTLGSNCTSYKGDTTGLPFVEQANDVCAYNFRGSTTYDYNCATSVNEAAQRFCCCGDPCACRVSASDNPCVCSTVAGPHADMRYPRALALDSTGDLFVACERTIVKWNSTITVLAELTATSLGITVNRTSNHEHVLFSRTLNVNTNSETNEVVSLVTDPPTAITAAHGRGDYYHYMVVDADGSLFVSVGNKHVVEKWKKQVDGSFVKEIVAGEWNSRGTRLQFDKLAHPEGLALGPQGELYIADRSNNRVLRWDLTSKTGTVVAGMGGQGAAADQLNMPFGICVDARGNLYVTERINKRVMMWAPNSTSGLQVGAADGLDEPKDVACREDDQGIYIADAGNQVLMACPQPVTSTTTSTTTSVDANCPNGWYRGLPLEPPADSPHSFVQHYAGRASTLTECASMALWLCPNANAATFMGDEPYPDGGDCYCYFNVIGLRETDGILKKWTCILQDPQETYCQQGWQRATVPQSCSSSSGCSRFTGVITSGECLTRCMAANSGSRHSASFQGGECWCYKTDPAGWQIAASGDAEVCMPTCQAGGWRSSELSGTVRQVALGNMSKSACVLAASESCPGATGTSWANLGTYPIGSCSCLMNTNGFVTETLTTTVPATPRVCFSAGDLVQPRFSFVQPQCAAIPSELCSDSTSSLDIQFSPRGSQSVGWRDIMPCREETGCFEPGDIVRPILYPSFGCIAVVSQQCTSSRGPEKFVFPNGGIEAGFYELESCPPTTSANPSSGSCFPIGAKVKPVAAFTTSGCATLSAPLCPGESVRAEFGSNTLTADYSGLEVCPCKSAGERVTSPDQMVMGLCATLPSDLCSGSQMNVEFDDGNSHSVSYDTMLPCQPLTCVMGAVTPPQFTQTRTSTTTASTSTETTSTSTESTSTMTTTTGTTVTNSTTSTSQSSTSSSSLSSSTTTTSLSSTSSTSGTETSTSSLTMSSSSSSSTSRTLTTSSTLSSTSSSSMTSSSSTSSSSRTVSSSTTSSTSFSSSTMTSSRTSTTTLTSSTSTATPMMASSTSTADPADPRTSLAESAGGGGGGGGGGSGGDGGGDGGGSSGREDSGGGSSATSAAPSVTIASSETSTTTAATSTQAMSPPAVRAAAIEKAVSETAAADLQNSSISQIVETNEGVVTLFSRDGFLNGGGPSFPRFEETRGGGRGGVGLLRKFLMSLPAGSTVTMSQMGEGEGEGLLKNDPFLNVGGGELANPSMSITVLDQSGQRVTQLAEPLLFKLPRGRATEGKAECVFLDVSDPLAVRWSAAGLTTASPAEVEAAGFPFLAGEVWCFTTHLSIFAAIAEIILGCTNVELLTPEGMSAIVDREGWWQSRAAVLVFCVIAVLVFLITVGSLKEQYELRLGRTHQKGGTVKICKAFLNIGPQMLKHKYAAFVVLGRDLLNCLRAGRTKLRTPTLKAAIQRCFSVRTGVSSACVSQHCWNGGVWLDTKASLPHTVLCRKLEFYSGGAEEVIEHELRGRGVQHVLRRFVIIFLAMHPLLDSLRLGASSLSVLKRATMQLVGFCGVMATNAMLFNFSGDLRSWESDATCPILPTSTFFIIVATLVSILLNVIPNQFLASLAKQVHGQAAWNAVYWCILLLYLGTCSLVVLTALSNLSTKDAHKWHKSMEWSLTIKFLGMPLVQTLRNNIMLEHFLYEDSKSNNIEVAMRLKDPNEQPLAEKEQLAVQEMARRAVSARELVNFMALLGDKVMPNYNPETSTAEDVLQGAMRIFSQEKCCLQDACLHVEVVEVHGLKMPAQEAAPSLGCSVIHLGCQQQLHRSHVREEASASAPTSSGRCAWSFKTSFKGLELDHGLGFTLTEEGRVLGTAQLTMDQLLSQKGFTGELTLHLPEETEENGKKTAFRMHSVPQHSFHEVSGSKGVVHKGVGLSQQARLVVKVELPADYLSALAVHEFKGLRGNSSPQHESEVGQHSQHLQLLQATSVFEEPGQGLFAPKVASYTEVGRQDAPPPDRLVVHSRKINFLDLVATLLADALAEKNAFETVQSMLKERDFHTLLDWLSQGEKDRKRYWVGMFAMGMDSQSLWHKDLIAAMPTLIRTLKLECCRRAVADLLSMVNPSCFLPVQLLVMDKDCKLLQDCDCLAEVQIAKSMSLSQGMILHPSHIQSTKAADSAKELGKPGCVGNNFPWTEPYLRDMPGLCSTLEALTSSAMKRQKEEVKDQPQSMNLDDVAAVAAGTAAANRAGSSGAVDDPARGSSFRMTASEGRGAATGDEDLGGGDADMDGGDGGD